MTKLTVAFHNFANAPKKAMKVGVQKPWAPGHPGRLISGRWRLTYVGFRYGTYFTLPFWRLKMWYRSYISGKFAATRIKVQGMVLFHENRFFFTRTAHYHVVQWFFDGNTPTRAHMRTHRIRDTGLGQIMLLDHTLLGTHFGIVLNPFPEHKSQITPPSSLRHQTVSKSSSCAKLIRH